MFVGVRHPRQASALIPELHHLHFRAVASAGTFTAG